MFTRHSTSLILESSWQLRPLDMQLIASVWNCFQLMCTAYEKKNRKRCTLKLRWTKLTFFFFFLHHTTIQIQYVNAAKFKFCVCGFKTSNWSDTSFNTTTIISDFRALLEVNPGPLVAGLNCSWYLVTHRCRNSALWLNNNLLNTAGSPCLLA